MPEIRKHAASVNRVSDYLGNLWRKGLVVRIPAPKIDGVRSRWLYAWKGPRGPKLYAAQGVDLPVKGIEYTPRVLADRPSILITEEGSTITVELPNLMLVIKTKSTT